MQRFACLLLLISALYASPILADPIEVRVDSDEAVESTGAIEIVESEDEWLTSSKTADLNGDGLTNTEDYRIWRIKQMPTVEPTPYGPPLSVDEWLASEEAADFDEDGAVDRNDYRIWASKWYVVIFPLPVDLPVMDKEKWAASDMATDLNGDGLVDETDYELWKNNPFIGVTAVSNASWGAIKNNLSR